MVHGNELSGELDLDDLAVKDSTDEKDESSGTQRRQPSLRLPSVSYATRVSGAFALIAAMTALILVGVLAVVWENQFQSYTRENMQSLARTTASTIGARYDEDGAWNTRVLTPAINASSFSKSIGVQVLDSNGRVMYDAVYATDVPQSLDGRPISVQPSRSNLAQAPILTADNERIGTVRIWAYGSEAFLTPNDAAFRESSYQAIIIAAAVAVGLAVIVGFAFSRGLVMPVRRITETAARVRDGDLSARADLEGEDELAKLGQTFDAMAASFQLDRESERRLIADVAHELRTPLMAIISTVEAIQDGVFEADQERLATLASESRRLSRLVDALLHLSRLESGSITFSPRPTNFVEMLERVRTTHEALISDAGREFVCRNDTGQDEVWVDVDRDMVGQAIVNLISNAVRYSEAGDVVTITLECDKKEVRIVVADTGMGISEVDMERIFGRFWRADAGRNRAQGGLGVGLSVTKEIMDKHHGAITVESELDVGTKFTLRFPRDGFDEHGNLLGSRAARAATKERKAREAGTNRPLGKGDNPVFIDEDDYLIG